MAAAKHYMHFLVKLKKGQTTGWYAPIELPDEGQQDGGFVVPVDAAKCLYDGYETELAVFSERGSFRVRTHELLAQKNGSFLLMVEDRPIRFRQRKTAWRALPYLGKLSHHDFSHHLVEIEPARDADLEDLLKESRIAIIGCHPFSHYGGIEKLSLINGNGRTPTKASLRKSVPLPKTIGPRSR